MTEDNPISISKLAKNYLETSKTRLSYAENLNRLSDEMDHLYGWINSDKAIDITVHMTFGGKVIARKIQNKANRESIARLAAQELADTADNWLKKIQQIDQA